MVRLGIFYGLKTWTFQKLGAKKEGLEYAFSWCPDNTLFIFGSIFEFFLVIRFNIISYENRCHHFSSGFQISLFIRGQSGHTPNSVDLKLSQPVILGNIFVVLSTVSNEKYGMGNRNMSYADLELKTNSELTNYILMRTPNLHKVMTCRNILQKWTKYWANKLCREEHFTGLFTLLSKNNYAWQLRILSQWEKYFSTFCEKSLGETADIWLQ